MRIKEKFNKKLLVEGNDDQHVIWALCEKFEVIENFDVIDCEGITKLYQQIPVRFKQSQIDTIGLIIDADSEIKDSWKSIGTLLTSQGFTIPESIPLEGLILMNSTGFKVGVWIMPNNNENGMLEDFISFLVPKDDKILPIVNETLTNIEKKGLNKYSLIHKSKATIHSWLSLQSDPGTPMGLSITKRYLTTEEETCLKLVNWLKELYK
ncbi:DUF3226 domain-containing protein [Flavobacterium oreochromis]|uniref:DUF3226 domain-containing protein n=1 Tax=Flavobacterium oreochromis TaxID=2906078 RepID=UPI00385A4FF7